MGQGPFSTDPQRTETAGKGVGGWERVFKVGFCCVFLLVVMADGVTSRVAIKLWWGFTNGVMMSRTC